MGPSFATFIPTVSGVRHPDVDWRTSQFHLGGRVCLRRHAAVYRHSHDLLGHPNFVEQLPLTGRCWLRLQHSLLAEGTWIGCLLSSPCCAEIFTRLGNLIWQGIVRTIDETYTAAEHDGLIWTRSWAVAFNISNKKKKIIIISIIIIMKKFNRRSSNGRHGSKRRELAQREHSRGLLDRSNGRETWLDRNLGAQLTDET